MIYRFIVTIAICLKNYYYLENVESMSKLQTSGSRTSCTREHVNNENKQTNNELKKCKNINNNDSFLY